MLFRLSRQRESLMVWFRSKLAGAVSSRLMVPYHQSLILRSLTTGLASQMKTEIRSTRFTAISKSRMVGRVLAALHV